MNSLCANEISENESIKIAKIKQTFKETHL